MDQLKDMTNEGFANYLEMVGDDYADSGSDCTAEDYREAARRIRDLDDFFTVSP